MNSLSEWIAIQDGLAEVTNAEAGEMFEWTCRYGGGNGWTGTSGDGARYVRALLIERHRLLQELYERDQLTQRTILD